MANCLLHVYSPKNVFFQGSDGNYRMKLKINCTSLHIFLRLTDFAPLPLARTSNWHELNSPQSIHWPPCFYDPPPQPGLGGGHGHLGQVHWKGIWLRHHWLGHQLVARRVLHRFLGRHWRHGLRTDHLLLFYYLQLEHCHNAFNF